MNLARALLVNATKGSDILAREAKVNKNNKPDNGSDASYLATIDLEDYPRARKYIRLAMVSTTMLFFVPITMGIVASVDYSRVLKSGAHAETVRGLWCVVTLLYSTCCHLHGGRRPRSGMLVRLSPSHCLEGLLMVSCGPVTPSPASGGALRCGSYSLPPLW